MRTIVVEIIFLVGCGGQAVEAPSDPEDRDCTAMDKALSIPRPPDSILAYSGRTMAGEVGSYCWSSAGSPAACADAAGIPLATEQQLSSGAELPIVEFAVESFASH